MLERLNDNIELIMNEFFPIGALKDSVGVTRLGYTEVEDEMHDKFLELARKFGLNTYVDEIGNSFAHIGDFDEYHLIGSHLDSVVDGGRYDGVAGVAIGLAIMKILVEDGKKLPLKTVAFRCEESANFMTPLTGSSLITGVTKFDTMRDIKSRTGISYEEIFKERGYSENPKKIDGIIDYIELHIEQARVLEDEELEIGIVNVITGVSSITGEIIGMAEHAGATPMNLRADSLAAVAEIILAVEEIGTNETPTSVGTVGFVENKPNAMNVVPGYTKFSMDTRDINNDSMASSMRKIQERILEICDRRKVEAVLTPPIVSPAVTLSQRMIDEFEQIAKRDGYKYKVMPSGAGHDCNNMAKFWDSILIFVPCKEGVSHNPNEYVSVEEMGRGAEIILKYLIEKNK